MKEIEKILIVDYGKPTKISEGLTKPSRELISSLIKDINESEKMLDKFDNFAFDSLAPLADETLDFITAMDGKSDTEIQHYKRAIKKLKEIISAAFSYRKSVVMICHIQSEKDEVTGRGRMNPLVWGKQLPSDIPKLFSEVFQATTETRKDGPGYIWRTQPDNWLGFLGTRRKDKLPPVSSRTLRSCMARSLSHFQPLSLERVIWERLDH